MRKSYDEICSIVESMTTDTEWSPAMSKTQWLNHIKGVISGASLIARKVSEKRGVVAVIHCSDGWDRTSQLSAIAQLLIDPFMRTIKGFIMLIEKEWLAFGHKFMDRNGTPHLPDERSPIFFQFLECVWQIMEQAPNEFEFNVDFLIRLADHSLSIFVAGI